MHAHDSPVELYLVGDGPIEDDLRRYATTHRVPVTFAGRIPHADLPPWYSAANVFVNPSPIEWFGLSIAEALACSLPVVASNAGGAIDNVDIFGSGLLVTPGDREALAKGHSTSPRRTAAPTEPRASPGGARMGREGTPRDAGAFRRVRRRILLILVKG